MTLWAKGQSGNPSGRPSLSVPVKSVFKREMRTNIGLLLKWRDDPDTPINTRVAIVFRMIEWVIGKPMQQQTLLLQQDDMSKMPSTELLAMLANGAGQNGNGELLVDEEDLPAGDDNAELVVEEDDEAQRDLFIDNGMGL